MEQVKGEGHPGAEAGRGVAELVRGWLRADPDSWHKGLSAGEPGLPLVPGPRIRLRSGRLRVSPFVIKGDTEGSRMTLRLGNAPTPPRLGHSPPCSAGPLFVRSF